MIERYSRKEMRELWNDQAKYESWLAVELAVCEVYHEEGKISDAEMKALRKADFDLERIETLEAETRHDVVAFTRAVSETLGDEKRWIHYGLTSTDVVDTAQAVRLKKVNAILLDDLHALQAVLKEKALAYKTTPVMGRTHGVHAEISSFGLKFALWFDELDRQLKRFDLACQDVETGKISGAVGNCLYTGTELQDKVCEKLGLHVSRISTQVLQRDRHAFYVACLALIATTLEKIALEFRHLQRTELREAEEGFAKGQKGSSAMPHKRNPISFENICGLARVMRSYLQPSFEDNALWHERDISHSSVERIILSDATILLDYMLNRLTRVLKNIQIFPERMKENIQLTHGVIFAQRVMNHLIENHQFSREKAYDLIQPLAMEAWTKQIDFRGLLYENDELMNRVSQEALDKCFDLDFYLKEVDAIYSRLGLKD